MESVDFMDRYLDPPDEPTHDNCDRCKHAFHVDDLTTLAGRSLCDECLAAEIAELEEE